MQAYHAKRVGKGEKIYLHAEIAALAACKQIERAHKMVVTRYSKDGRPMPAKPCEICADGIKHSPIKIIEHT